MQNTSNGLTYDFGIAISQGTVSALVQTVAAASALAGSIYALTSATNALDDAIYKNQVAFGGYENTLKAIQFASDQIASGQAFFDETEILAGMKAIQRAGLDAKKNFKLVNDAASATGVSFTDMASAIETGNFSTLAEAGVITNRMAQSLDAVGMNAQMATKKMMSLIQEANKKGLFDNTITTFPAIYRRFQEFGKRFIRAIIGDPKDPNGLMVQVKQTFTDVANWFNTNLHKIQKVGAVIGQVLKFMFNVISDVGKRIWKSISGILGSNEKFFANFGDKMMSFQLYLEILRVKINAFFDEYGDRIKTIAKIAGIALLLRELDLYGGKALTFAKALTSAYQAGQPIMRGFFSSDGLLNQLKIGDKVMAMFRLGFVGSIKAATTAAWEFVAAAMANPYVWVAIAIAALIAMIVYWDEIRASVTQVSDGMLVLLALFVPVVGWVMIIAKYWNEISAILQNVWAIITNIATIVVNTLWAGITGMFNDAMGFLKEFAEPLYNVFLWISDLVTTIVNSILSIDLGKWLGKAADWLAGAADSTAKIAEESGKLGGPIKTGTTGTTVASQTQQDTKKLAEQGKNPQEIAQIQGRSQRQVAADLNTTTTPIASPIASTNSQSSVNVSQGAVVINLGKDSGIDEEKLAIKIKKILDDFSKKGAYRDGMLQTT